ncbi:ABC transporter ATP-binding protein [Pseudonocardia xishanensis]|uniref:ABC transporter ATP-binding protein n=1 Tax=Pseudonocardia xishanensis TaxID=630995 RepID=A0ABP8REI2_9PSEU
MNSPSEPLAPGISFRDVQLRFGGQVVLEGVTLDLPGARLTGLIGPNGSGKTSLCNVATGVYRPDAGEVVVLGRDTRRLGAHAFGRMAVARTFQHAAVVPELTAWENVALGLPADERISLLRTISGSRRSRRIERGYRDRAVGVLDELGLADRADTPAAELTNLERKFVEVARCLVRAPQVLVLDEVASGLTRPEKAQLSEFVRTAFDDRCRGALVVVIEHDVEFIRGLCSHIVVLDRGRVLAEGTTAEVLADDRVRSVYLGGVAAQAR